MNLISRYIIRAIVLPFLFGTGVVVFLFLMQFLAKHLDKIVGKGLDNWVVFQLISYNMAWMLILAVPLGVLFASLMAFGNLASNSEVTVMKSSGVSLIRMMVPVLICATLLSYVLFLYDSQVVPDINHKARILLYDIHRKKPTFAVEKGQFCYEIDRYTILARDIDTLTNTLLNVTIYDNNFAVINRTINAARCDIVFTPDMKSLNFMLSDGDIFQSAQNSPSNFRQINFTNYQLTAKAQSLNFEQSDTGDVDRIDTELKIADIEAIISGYEKELNDTWNKQYACIEEFVTFLVSGTFPMSENNIVGRGREESFINMNDRRHISNINNVSMSRINDFVFRLKSNSQYISSRHIDINSYRAEIHKKYAIPATCIIFILIGCPLGVIIRGGNFGLSAIVTLGFYVVY